MGYWVSRGPWGLRRCTLRGFCGRGDPGSCWGRGPMGDEDGDGATDDNDDADDDDDDDECHNDYDDDDDDDDGFDILSMSVALCGIIGFVFVVT